MKTRYILRKCGVVADTASRGRPHERQPDSLAVQQQVGLSEQ